MSSRQVAAVALAAALWGVLNSFFSPVLFSLTGLPVLCDLIGFTVLTVSAWWIRKLGAATAIGLVATAINFALNPQAVIFLGFTVASPVFDLAFSAIGYKGTFSNHRRTFGAGIMVSVLSAAVAGGVIGFFFMAGPAMAVWGGVAGWVGLHVSGGLVGGALGGLLTTMLAVRKVSVA